MYVFRIPKYLSDRRFKTRQDGFGILSATLYLFTSIVNGIGELLLDISKIISEVLSLKYSICNFHDTIMNFARREFCPQLLIYVPLASSGFSFLLCRLQSSVMDSSEAVDLGLPSFNIGLVLDSPNNSVKTALNTLYLSDGPSLF